MPANSSHIALQSFHLMNLEWRAHYPLAETGVLLCPFQRPGLLSSCYKVIWPSHRSLCSLSFRTATVRRTVLLIACPRN